MRPIITRCSRQFLFLHKRCLRIHKPTRSKLKVDSPLDPPRKDLNLKTTRLDPITLHRLKLAQEAYYKRRMVYSAIGVLFGMVGLFITAIQVPVSSETPTEESISNSSTINRLESRRPDDDPMMTLGREHKVVTQNLGEVSKKLDNFVSTGNSVVPEFPRILKLDNSSGLDSDQTEYQLLGLGVRTVSFLNIQVYVVGIYIATDDIVVLQNKLIKRINPLATTLVVNEKDELKFILNDPEKSEQLWDTILEHGACRMLIRIVPTRNTDFAHLRDAWVRLMTSRAQKAGWNDEKFGGNVAQFKKIFARGSVPKATELILSRGKQGNLDIWYHGTGRGQGDSGTDKLGELEDERISRAVWLGYLAGKAVACEGAREGTIASLLKFVERPTGAGIRQ